MINRASLFKVPSLLIFIYGNYREYLLTDLYISTKCANKSSMVGMIEKIVTASAISLLIVSTPVVVMAQGQGQGQLNGVQQRVQDPTTHDGETIVPQGDQLDQAGQAGAGNQVGSGAMGQGIGKATQSLNRVAERTNNPEIGEQVRTMVQSHQQIQTKVQTAVQAMSKRNGVVKFLLGPDYKNAGQVRSNVVDLRNDIDKLERMKADATASDVEDIQTAIDELQIEADTLDAQLEEELSGFSLFGWLARRFAN